MCFHLLYKRKRRLTSQKTELLGYSELPFSVFMCRFGKLCFLARLLLFGWFLMVHRGRTVDGYIATFCFAVADNQSYWKSSWVDRVSPISVGYINPGPKCLAASRATITGKSHTLTLVFVSCSCFTTSKIICPEHKKNIFHLCYRTDWEAGLSWSITLRLNLQLHCDCNFTRVGSPDCRYWCRLHSSGSPKLSLGFRLELIAGSRRSHPSAGKHREREEQVGSSPRLVSWRGKDDCRCVKPGENDAVRSVKIKWDSKLIPFTVFCVQRHSLNYSKTAITHSLITHSSFILFILMKIIPNIAALCVTASARIPATRDKLNKSSAGLCVINWEKK